MSLDKGKMQERVIGGIVGKHDHFNAEIHWVTGDVDRVMLREAPRIPSPDEPTAVAPPDPEDADVVLRQIEATIGTLDHSAAIDGPTWRGQVAAKVTKLVRQVAPRQEIPACAAIQFSDGTIIAGKRHDICIKSAVALKLTRHDVAEAVQGFMTTQGRFVDRTEGWRLAITSGMVIDRPGVKILFSEDLY